MSRKVRQVEYRLDPKRGPPLSEVDLRAILRGADEMIMRGGRNLLAKLLKGSRAKEVLSLDLQDSPVYGYFAELALEEILARIDRAIVDRYLKIEYDYRLPMLCFTEAGWEIERETYATELLAGFDRMLAAGGELPDMTYLVDRNRGMILLLLAKVESTADPKYIPLLERWAEVDHKKVVARIRQVIARIRGETKEPLL